MMGEGEAIHGWVQDRLRARGVFGAVVDVGDGRPEAVRADPNAAAGGIGSMRTYRVDVLMPRSYGPMAIADLIDGLGRDLDVQPRLGDRLERSSAGTLQRVTGAAPGRLIVEISVSG